MHWYPGGRVGGHEAAVGLHDEERSADADLPQSLPQRVEVAADHRHHVGIDHRRRGPLVLPDLGQDLRADRQRQAGRPPPDDGRDLLLVNRVGVGVDEADGQSLDGLLKQPVKCPLDVGRVQRGEDVAAGADPLVHLQAQITRDQGRRLFPGQVVEPWHTDPSDLEDVAEPLGRDQPGPGPSELQDRVGGHGGAVNDLAHVTPAEAGLAEDVAEALADGPGVVVHAGGDLLRVDVAVGVQEDDVGEGAADVDADAE